MDINIMLIFGCILVYIDDVLCEKFANISRELSCTKFLEPIMNAK